MKKILSLTLAALMVVSMVPTAFAAETQDISLGTAVTVEGAGGEYTVTVPAALFVGDVGTVTAKGYWAANETLKVTAPETIEVTNTVTNQKTTVNVDFDGIESLGDDLNEMNVPVDISIDAGNTKFGTWTGVIEYEVVLAELITFSIKDTNAGTTETYQAKADMTWEQWLESDYNTLNQTAVIKDDKIHQHQSSGAFIRNGVTAVSPSDMIVADTTYNWL